MTNQRKDYIPLSEILSDVERALSTIPRKEIDWITFVGSGEPTLHAGIGWLIRQVKRKTEIPVAVITNGSLLFVKSVRKDLLEADAVLPSLDAGTAALYMRINRPHPDIAFDRYVAGLIEFRNEYRGRYWLEVMLVQGLNDSVEALEQIEALVEKINPDQVHINLPTRPPAEKWVQPTDQEGIMRASLILGEVAHVIQPNEGSFVLECGGNYVEALIGIITRHPMSEDQLLHSLELLPEVKRAQIIQSLSSSKKVQIIERYGQSFWCASPAVFPDSRKEDN
jgi:wyosine [tRNA(Phe)-imidazoG37] synthetase (radical SAM superfamily)